MKARCVARARTHSHPPSPPPWQACEAGCLGGASELALLGLQIGEDGPVSAATAAAVGGDADADSEGGQSTEEGSMAGGSEAQPAAPQQPHLARRSTELALLDYEIEFVQAREGIQHGEDPVWNAHTT